MGLNGTEIYRIKSKTVFKTYMIDINTNSVAVSGLTAKGGRGWKEAAMPNKISENGGGNIYGKYDYLIASETGYFNQYKNAGITPAHTNGKTIGDPSTVPDLDPSLVKSIIMQETGVGTAASRGSNDASSDIMQANVYYGPKSNDWNDGKTQFGLEKEGGATPEQSVRAGIGILYQKGLETKSGKTRFRGWNQATDRYNGGGVDNYGGKVRTILKNSKPQ